MTISRFLNKLTLCNINIRNGFNNNFFVFDFLMIDDTISSMVSDIKQQLQLDLKNALKAKDSSALGVIRFLLAEIKNVEIDHGELDDDGVQQIVRRQLKQITEARDQFRVGGRDDLVAEEQLKSDILSAYLPQPLSEEELITIIQAVIDETSDKTLKSVMPVAIKAVGGKADGKTVSTLVQQLLK